MIATIFIFFTIVSYICMFHPNLITNHVWHIMGGLLGIDVDRISADNPVE